jgi:hypothetical protein
LPPKSYTLYLIASAFEKHASTASKALENGTISPAMTQEEGRELLILADRNAKNPASSPLFSEDGEKPPREPRTENPQKPPATDEQKQEKKQKKADEQARQEALAEDEGFLSLPRIKADLKLEESEYCLRKIRHEIEESGEIEPEVLRQVLNARVNYPDFFHTMYLWDHYFKQMAVTMALRELGYK